jgi:glycosyltransferase involved in cell wall biosynthesis
MGDDQDKAWLATGQSGRPVFLHVFNSFGCGGAQTRFVQLANHFGSALRHVVISRNGDYSGARQLEPGADVVLHPWQESKAPLPVQIRRISTALSAIRPACLVTHNWGTMDWVVARFGARARHIHIEDGFGPDESLRLKRRRALARRVLLRRSDVVVPSLTLKRIAETSWNIPLQRLHFIPNGIDCTRFSAPAGEGDFIRSPAGAPTIGTVAALRPEKNVARLLRAFALVRRRQPCNLVIVGDGPERPGLVSLASSLNIKNSVQFVGHVENPVACYRSFDVFVLTSDTEQMPYTVLEAMATGLPVVATNVGDVLSMVSPENGSLIVDKDDEQIASAILKAIDEKGFARDVGNSNRNFVRLRFDREAMFAAFGTLYGLPPQLALNAFRHVA